MALPAGELIRNDAAVLCKALAVLHNLPSDIGRPGAVAGLASDALLGAYDCGETGRPLLCSRRMALQTPLLR